MTESSATPVRNVVSNEVLIAEYRKAAQNGETIHALADRLKMKAGSLSVRVSKLRQDLIARGLNDEQVQRIIPSLTRKTPVGHTSKRSDFLDALVLEATTAPVDETPQA